MEKIFFISLTTENTLRVLQRISTVFSRQRVNIEQLNVFETKKQGISHFSIVIHANDIALEKLVKQLKKIIELLDVRVSHQIAIENEMQNSMTVM